MYGIVYQLNVQILVHLIVLGFHFPMLILVNFYLLIDCNTAYVMCHGLRPFITNKYDNCATDVRMSNQSNQIY